MVIFMKETTINKQVYDWLAHFYDTDTRNITSLLDCQIATTYLLIWPVMEQNLFSGFMKQDKIAETAERYVAHYSEMKIEKDVKYFYDRYQDRRLYRNLKHGTYYTEIDEILRKNYNTITPVEKLQLMIFVVYRYRNNIFHGSKGIDSWLQFSDQIEKCISFMMKIVDCHERYYVAK